MADFIAPDTPIVENLEPTIDTSKPSSIPEQSTALGSSTGPLSHPLLNLPVEIFQIIFQSLSSKDFYSLCLVCKTFHDLAEPWLYSEIKWTQSQYWSQSDFRSAPIISLLQTIFSRPELAIHTQNLTLDAGNIIRHQNHLYGYSETELQHPIAFIKKLGVSYAYPWISYLRLGISDAFVALLLSQLLNLKYLCISGGESKIIGMVLRSYLCKSIHCGLPHFQQLRDVSFNVEFDTRIETLLDAPNTADVLPFFYLPSLQSLSVSIDNPHTFAWPTDVKPLPSTLTSLDLSFIREGHLGQIISLTTNLKILRWKWYFHEDFSNEVLNAMIDYDLIVDALSHVQDTLAELIITAKNVRISGFAHPISVNGSLRGLVNFHSLKRFTINLEFLLGLESSPTFRFEDVLPKYIEVLTLTNDEDPIQETPLIDYWVLFKAFKFWLKDWRTSTPHIRSIHLLLSYDYCEEDCLPRREPWECDLTMRTDLEILGEQEGVLIEVVNVS